MIQIIGHHDPFQNVVTFSTNSGKNQTVVQSSTLDKSSDQKLQKNYIPDKKSSFKPSLKRKRKPVDNNKTKRSNSDSILSTGIFVTCSNVYIAIRKSYMLYQILHPL